MKLQTILSLVLATTGVSHLTPQNFNANGAPALLERAVPEKITSIKVAEIDVPEADKLDSGRCNAAQVDKLNNAISEARGLFHNAKTALDYPGVDKSPAYRLWFGKQKATLTDLLKMHNFQTPFEGLDRPLDEVAEIVSPKTLDPTAVTFTCWSTNHRNYQGTEVAGTQNPGSLDNRNQGLKGTIIGLCQKFFELRQLDNVVKTFDPKNKEMSLSSVLSAAFALVHEMQHVRIATGMERFCEDHEYEIST